MDCMNNALSFTDELVGEVERRGRGTTLYFGRAITKLLDEVRLSNIDRSFDRSGKITTAGSDRFSR